MSNIPAGTRIFIATEPCDMRKQHSGLAAVVRASTGGSPAHGRLYIFWNRRRDMLKILFRDAHGYCLLAKRLDRGAFKISMDSGNERSSIEINQGEFAALMSNLTISR
jgi:transposase